MAELNPRKMKEPLRTLLLQGTGTMGTYRSIEVLSYIEEQLTRAQYDDAKKFLDWMVKHNLTFGHGTIDLRYHEFNNDLTPMASDEAYNWAMKRAGL
jgi:hypothetical protein